MDPEHLRHSLQGGSAHPERGLIGLFVPQHSIRQRTVNWSEDSPVTRVSAVYEFATGREEGRRLDGAVSTFLLQGSANWDTIESLATADAREFIAANPEARSSDMEPKWEPVVVMVNDDRAPARQTIIDGYEVITFPIDDRVVSSVISVYDAGDLDVSFAVEIWPPTTQSTPNFP